MKARLGANICTQTRFEEEAKLNSKWRNRSFLVAFSLFIKVRLDGTLCTQTRFEKEAKLDMEMVH